MVLFPKLFSWSPLLKRQNMVDGEMSDAAFDGILDIYMCKLIYCMLYLPSFGGGGGGVLFGMTFPSPLLVCNLVTEDA